MARVSDEGQGWVFSSGSDTARYGSGPKRAVSHVGTVEGPLSEQETLPQTARLCRRPGVLVPRGLKRLPAVPVPLVTSPLTARPGSWTSSIPGAGRRARQGRPGRRRQSASSRSASRPRAAPPGSGAALSSGRGRSEGLPRAVRALHFLPTRGLLDVQRRESNFFWLRRPLCPARVQVQTTRPGRHAELVVRGVSRPGAPAPRSAPACGSGRQGWKRRDAGTSPVPGEAPRPRGGLAAGAEAAHPGECGAPASPAQRTAPASPARAAPRRPRPGGRSGRPCVPARRAEAPRASGSGGGGGDRMRRDSE